MDNSGASERTRLSWRRTSLTVTIVGILLARLALHRGGGTSAIVACALAAICWVVVLVLIHHRVHALPKALASIRMPLVTAAACVCLAGLGVVLVVG